jgi:hypothetical protein
MKTTFNYVVATKILGVYSFFITLVLIAGIVKNFSTDSSGPINSLLAGSVPTGIKGKPGAINSAQLQPPSIPQEKQANTQEELLAYQKAKKQESFRELCQTDARKAWDSLAQDGGDLSELAWQYSAGALVAAEGRSACNEVFQHTGPNSAAARTAAILTLSRTSPEEFRLFFKENNLPLSVDLATKIGALMSDSDPKSAIEWSESLEDAKHSRSALNGAFEGWFQRDAAAATTWLRDNKKGKGKDDLIEQVIGATWGHDPEAALAWAGELDDEGRRLEVIERSLLSFAAKDIAAAENWLKESSLDLKQKQNLADVLKVNLLQPHGGSSISKGGIVTILR